MESSRVTFGCDIREGLSQTTEEKKNESKVEEIVKARKRDHDSHFILRLAYCRTEELRRWFVAQETDLFRARFMRASCSGSDFTQFLNLNDLHFMQVSDEEIKIESINLVAGTYNLASIDQLESKVFFKVPFTQALELVRSRKVFVKDGFAFVPSSDLVTLVAAVFRTKLSHALAITSRLLSQIEDDERLVKLLHDFDKRYTGSDYSQKKAGPGQHITPDMINKLSVKSFPLCMRQMQEQLCSQHHMKHGGRMQYGLFLKAAGLSLEDALQFWRSHFTKNMDIDKFEKQYAYNIRHNYGKEGKRTDYTPYSCMKIITSNVGPGDSHGCPFKHLNIDILHQKLLNSQISQQASSEIVDLVKGNHYQIACQHYFEASHHSNLEAGINHPNQYFEESMSIIHGLKTPNTDLFFFVWTAHVHHYEYLLENTFAFCRVMLVSFFRLTEGVIRVRCSQCSWVTTLNVKGSSSSQIKTQQSIMMSQPPSQAASTLESQKADISGVECMLLESDLDDSILEEMEL